MQPFSTHFDNADYSKYFSLLSYHVHQVPEAILKVIAIQSTGKIIHCACPKCENEICLLFKDIGAKSLPESWIQLSVDDRYFCGSCVKTGPVRNFSCCIKCVHQNPKARCVHHDESRQNTCLVLCRFPQTFRGDGIDPYNGNKVAYDCDEHRTGIWTTCCGNFLCTLHWVDKLSCKFVCEPPMKKRKFNNQ